MADPQVQIIVSPRFEIFYALQALESGAGEKLANWRRTMERRLPARTRTSLASVAPSPLIWPLLADALRESPPAVTFPEMMTSLRAMEPRQFQRFVLGGVFKTAGAVEGLVSGRAGLTRTVATEAKTQQRLLAVLGLHPFSRRSPSAVVFESIVAEPGRYRDEVVDVLEAFWTSGFAETWALLQPQMHDSTHVLRQRIARRALADISSDLALPITTEGDDIVGVRGATRIPARAVDGIYVLPSVFNTSKLWAAYADARKRTRFFIPLQDSDLSLAGAIARDASLVFKALGDTTRYAMATMIARKPMTSVALARAFGVSKPTISHHVQIFRAAGLLQESQSDNGVMLSLHRRALERAAAAAAREMFTDDDSSQVVKRTRKANRRI